MNSLSFNKTILLCDKQFIDNTYHDQVDKLKAQFYGIVCEDISTLKLCDDKNKCVYICGDIDIILKCDIFSAILDASQNTQFTIIKEFTHIKEFTQFIKNKYELVTLGEIPINIHNVGVMFRNLFPTKTNYFSSITKEHDFQVLSASNKSSSAHRKGIYLTPITKTDDELKFNLLRCSTTLSGGSDNFRDTDKDIVKKVNNIKKYIFDKDVTFNHVLAQVYHNFTDGTKDRKAKIKSHSDKTKDMPKEGLIAFCTFYDVSKLAKDKQLIKNKDNEYDICYKKTSALTKLRFKLKECVKDTSLTKNFDIILYPNSVFMMSLETNRLYTHEISPSLLPSDKILTRIGYVVRCSTTEASYKDNKTYILEREHDHKSINNKYIKLSELTAEDFIKLKKKYAIENLTTETPDYSHIYFSMNKGDYIRPIY